MRSLPAFLALLLLPLAGCSNPDRTIETLRKEIAAFSAAPTKEADEKILKLFAQLDQQIADMEQHGQNVKASALKELRGELKVKYTAAKFGAAWGQVGSAIQGMSEAIQKAGREISDSLRQPTPEDGGSKDSE